MSCPVHVLPAAPGFDSSLPTIIFSSGFLVSSAAYTSYLTSFSQNGYCCITYDKVGETATEPVDDLDSAAIITQVMDWATSAPLTGTAAAAADVLGAASAGDAAPPAAAPPRRFVLAGHSRGAKLSALAAAQDLRVSALLLVDPVNASYDTAVGPRFPSAFPLLSGRSAGRLPGPLPVLVIGGGHNGDCVPKSANYAQFYAASPGPAALLLLNDVGHFQVLDGQDTLQAALCSAGRVDAVAVRLACQAAMLAWLAALPALLLPASTALPDSLAGLGSGYVPLAAAGAGRAAAQGEDAVRQGVGPVGGDIAVVASQATAPVRGGLTVAAGVGGVAAALEQAAAGLRHSLQVKGLGAC